MNKRDKDVMSMYHPTQIENILKIIEKELHLIPIPIGIGSLINSTSKVSRLVKDGLDNYLVHSQLQKFHCKFLSNVSKRSLFSIHYLIVMRRQLLEKLLNSIPFAHAVDVRNFVFGDGGKV